MKGKKWVWVALAGALGIWIAVLCFWGKSSRAVIIFDDRVLSNGPDCGVKMYVMKDGACVYEFREDGSKHEGETKCKVDKENHSISLSYDHPLGTRYVRFTFDTEKETYDCKSPVGSSFELFEVEKMDWERVPSLLQ